MAVEEERKRVVGNAGWPSDGVSIRDLLEALNPKFKSKGPDEPGLCGWVAASHIHIAHAAHATTHAAATTALVVLGQFGDHRVGREHQSRD